MQLTRFDRWLREKFVYETHIHTLRPPDAIPRGIRVVDLPDIPGKRYKHLFVAGSSRLADALIQQLKQDGQMYTTQVVDRKSWYVPFIAPKGKSLSWWLISTIIITISIFAGLIYLKGLTEDAEFRKNFIEAVNLFKNG
jgi:hypothetical protein